jgi:hypothetical protein
LILHIYRYPWGISRAFEATFKRLPSRISKFSQRAFQASPKALQTIKQNHPLAKKFQIKIPVKNSENKEAHQGLLSHLRNFKFMFSFSLFAEENGTREKLFFIIQFGS